MKRSLLTVSTLAISLLISSPVLGDEEQFDSEKLLSDLEKELNLSKEQIEKLKPVIKEKSSSLQQSIHEAVDKGFIELDKLSEQFDSLSGDIEAKTQEFLKSEEVAKLKEYLGKVDKEALEQARDSLVAELSSLLELTEEQATKIKPILVESFTDISELLNQLLNSSAKSFDEFKLQFDKITSDLKKQLEGILDQQQMDKLDEHSEELKETIQQAVFTTEA